MIQDIVRYTGCIAVFAVFALFNVGCIFLFNENVYRIIDNIPHNTPHNNVDILANVTNNTIMDDKNIKLISPLEERFPKWSLDNRKYPFRLNSYNEYYINCDTNKTTYNVTITSGLLLIDETAINGTSPDKKKSHDYKNTITKLLTYTYQPLILFISNNIEHTSMFDNIISIRTQTKYPPTIIISINIKDTEYYPYIKQKLLQFNSTNYFDNELQLTKCSVWNEKIVFLHNTALRNPFNSQYFFWLDGGILRYHHNCEFFKTFPMKTRLPVLNNNKLAFGVRKNFTCDIYKQKYLDYRKRAVTGTYAGTRIAVLNAYNSYKTTLNEFFNSKHGIMSHQDSSVICDDQEVMSFSSCNNPELFSTIYETHNNGGCGHYYQMLNLFGNGSWAYDPSRTWIVSE